MRHRYLALVLLGLAGCGGGDAPSGDRPETSAAAPASPSGPTAEAPTGVPIVETPSPNGGEVTQPAGELAGAAEQPGAEEPTPSNAAGDTPTTPAVPQEPAPAGSQSSNILARAEAALARIETLEADFTSRTTNFLTGDTIVGHGKFYSRMPDRFLMRYTDPAGDYILGDGQYLYTYYPTNDPVTITRVPLAAAGEGFNFYRDFVENAAERYNITVGGTETVGGRPAQVVTLVPKQRMQYRQVRIWIDTQDALVRRFETTEHNDVVRRIEMSNLRVNPSLASDLFRFQQPPGTQIFDASR